MIADRIKHIAIAGNIGCGKTTLALKLSKHYNWHAELEAVDNNPYLEDFYKDMKTWSFHLQVFFLNSRFKQVQKIRQSPTPVIQDRTIYEDAFIFAKNLHDSKLISERDFANYFELFQSMRDFIQPPDLLIYLKSDIPKLVDQIQKRGREYEQAISIEYLKKLNDHYENWISGYDDGKLLIIDSNPLDFANRVEDFASIVQKIDLEINGLFS
jgi:deoxyadenosine/deoxycytidine kinase